jgi:CRP-like cAMP-binding protein
MSGFAWDKNHILAKLKEADRASLAHEFREVDLEIGQVLHEPHEKMQRAYFPFSGMVSILLVTESGDAIETGIVDRQGVVGGSIISDADISFGQHIVQMAGAALTISAGTLKKICAQNETLREAINRYEPVVLLQAQQSTACHALHSVSQRLSRWLLHSEDVAESKTFFLTQEFLAHMLGVRRSSVSTQAQELQNAGLIEYSRGHVEILNRKGLEKTSCECYRVVRKYLDSMK